MRYCVLIPSYNEAKTIGRIVGEVKAMGLWVLVVDDGSTDRTSSVAAASGAEIIRNPVNMGKGAALRKGFDHVLRLDLEAVVIMDGDGQHKVDDIDNFVKKMEETGADMVIGNRMTDTVTMPGVRVGTNQLMSYFISTICGHSIPDTQCGFRMIKLGVLRKIKLKSDRFEIESEMIIRAARARFKIESVPVKTVYQDEKSRIDQVIDALRFIALIIRIFIGR